MSEAAGSGSKRAYLRLLGMQEMGVLVALAVLCGFLTLRTSAFLTPLNLMQVARQASYYGIMGVGMVFVLSVGEVDLSVGSILTLTNVITALALRNGQPVAVAVLLGLLNGAACGLLNGILSVVLRIPTIIVTLGTMSIYRGLALMLSNASPVTPPDKSGPFFTVGGGQILGAPTSAVVMVLIGAAGWLAMTRTVYGRRVEAIGSNPATARLSGIAVPRYRVGVMTLNGIIAAVAGIVALAFLQSADPSTGPGFELWVIASAIIGGTALSGGHGSVPGAILGALIIAVINNGLVLLDAPAYAGVAATGAVIIAAVSIDAVVKRRAAHQLARQTE